MLYEVWIVAQKVDGNERENTGSSLCFQTQSIGEQVHFHNELQKAAEEIKTKEANNGQM